MTTPATNPPSVYGREPLVKLLGRTDLLQLATPQDRHALREVERLLLLVRHQHGGDI